MSKKTPHEISFTVLYSSIIAALGAFLFGYHTAIISGANLFITEEFHLTTFQQELGVSIILIGCFIGALCAGISDFLGRKMTLFLTVFLYLMATFCLLDAMHFGVVLIGRFVAGIAVGIASVTVPLYIAEISPPKKRGALVAINQLMVTVGILVSYLVAYVFAPTSDWRGMFAFAFIPAGIQFVGLFFIPETPHWLLSKGRTQAAEKAMHRLRIASPREHLIKEEKKSDRPIKRSFRALLDPKVRTPFIIGVGISIFQQITGINTVIYYAPHIFQLAGFSSNGSALAATFWLGVVLVLTTLLGLFLIDRVGRRLLSLIGMAGMGVSLFVLGLDFLFFHGGEVGVIAIISLLAYISFFSATLGIIAWVIISEIYPLGVRGRAMSIASSGNWAANFVVSLTFLTLIQLLSIGGAYWLYALICAFGFYFVWKKVPETKGKTFEEIQKFWQK
jgi:sugar porter (SP) family MFS transporter